MQFIRPLMLGLAGLMFISSLLAEEEIQVGHNAVGQLQIRKEYAPPLVLERSVFPGIPGYATGEVGFHSTILDDSNGDFFQLSTGADFRLVLLAKDPGMEVWNDHGSGYLNIGEMFFIGEAPFDTHPIFDIVKGTPGHIYSLTFQLHDLNAVYPDSAPFNMTFTPWVDYFPLNLVRSDAGHVRLSWSTNAVDWKLMSSPELNSSGFTLVTNAPDVVGTNFEITIPAAQAQQFFQLKLP